MASIDLGETEEGNARRLVVSAAGAAWHRLTAAAHRMHCTLYTTTNERTAAINLYLALRGATKIQPTLLLGYCCILGGLTALLLGLPNADGNVQEIMTTSCSGVGGSAGQRDR